jgi:hypothetical protein
MFTAPSLLNQARVAIENQVENSREKSLALTKLDECLLWLSLVSPVKGRES